MSSVGTSIGQDDKNKMNAKKDPASNTTPKIKTLKSIDHSTHGRGTENDGPDDEFCPCTTERQETIDECATSGCGFCRCYMSSATKKDDKK